MCREKRKVLRYNYGRLAKTFIGRIVETVMDDFNSLKRWEKFIDGEKRECRADIIYPSKWELTSPKPIRL